MTATNEKINALETAIKSLQCKIDYIHCEYMPWRSEQIEDIRQKIIILDDMKKMLENIVTCESCGRLDQINQRTYVCPVLMMGEAVLVWRDRKACEAWTPRQEENKQEV